MSRRAPPLPLSIIASFALLVALLVLGALPSPVMVVAQSIDCSGDLSDYPGLTYDTCQATQTAVVARTQTATAAGGSGQTAAPTNTSAPASGAPAATATPTLTRTATVTTTARTLTPTLAASPAASPTASPTRQAAAATAGASPTPTSALPAGVEARICLPGSSVELTGTTRPAVALLAYFDDRPVGGALSRADGSYSISLRIGPERPGLYLIEVRERDTRDLVSQEACEIPGLTPTATPEAP